MLVLGLVHGNLDLVRSKGGKQGRGGKRSPEDKGVVSAVFGMTCDICEILVYRN